MLRYQTLPAPSPPGTGIIRLSTNPLTLSASRSRNRVNGSTQTFRRPSVAANASNNRDGPHNAPPTPSANAGVYIPPHLHSNNSSSHLRNGVSGEGRYSKDQMIDIYKAQRDSGALSRNLEQLFSGDWNPFEQRDEATLNWDKRDKGKDQTTTGPEICWIYQVDDDPLSLLEMTDEEKEVRLEPYCLALVTISHTILGICDVGELPPEASTGHYEGW
jgi:PERQ amino acid-rich with GYF domain-containing protein